MRAVHTLCYNTRQMPPTRTIEGGKTKGTNEMKKLGNYINNHSWAQVAVCAIIVGAFWALAEIGFRLIHGVAL